MQSSSVMDTTTNTIDKLNSFLRDELAAIETYEEALHGRSAFSGKTELSQCQRSHELRVNVLRDKIVSLGGKPATTSGFQGAWKKLIEGTAVAIGPDTAIRALESGEDNVLRDYRKGIQAMDPDVRTFLERTCLPEEEYTHRTLSELKHRLASA
jgi:bacterioferritin (cytochrome b1)